MKRTGLGYWIDKDGYAITDRVIDGKRVHLRVHRLVMEEFLGRKLVGKEQIHHKDGNKLNNNIENLELVPSSSEHILRHHNKPWNLGMVTKFDHHCERCGKAFTAIRQRVRRFCGRTCSARAALELMYTNGAYKKFL